MTEPTRTHTYTHKYIHTPVMVELVQGRILATKDVHFVLEVDGLVTAARRRGVEGLDLLPLVALHVPAEKLVVHRRRLAVAELAAE
jgi:hypothetical protein